MLKFKLGCYTGFMVIHPLVVISFNKTLPRLKANAVESASLRASQFVLYLLSTSCVHTLAYSTLFPLFFLGILYCCSVPADAREFTQSYQEYEDFQAFVSQSTSLWRPAQLPRDFVYVLHFRILCIRHFVINVINNICISLYYILLHDMCCDILFILLYIHVT